MTERTHIYVGDSFPFEVSWFIPDESDPYLESDAIISTATATIVRARDHRVILSNEPATISGNETTFIVPPEHTQITGTYNAYMTAELNDSSVLTRKVSYEVLPKR